MLPLDCILKTFFKKNSNTRFTRKTRITRGGFTRGFYPWVIASFNRCYTHLRVLPRVKRVIEFFLKKFHIFLLIQG